LFLPAALGYAWNQTFVGRLAEAYPAKAELPHKSMLSTATETTADNPGFEFWRSF
jgi:hypothetical protein